MSDNIERVLFALAYAAAAVVIYMDAFVWRPN